MEEETEEGGLVVMGFAVVLFPVEDEIRKFFEEEEEEEEEAEVGLRFDGTRCDFEAAEASGA